MAGCSVQAQGLPNASCWLACWGKDGERFRLMWPRRIHNPPQIPALLTGFLTRPPWAEYTPRHSVKLVFHFKDEDTRAPNHSNDLLRVSQR